MEGPASGLLKKVQGFDFIRIAEGDIDLRTLA
jgi:hypothetical protein